MAEEHTTYLQSVRKGDDVEITTTTGNTFDAKCVGHGIENADPRTGEIKHTTWWEFEAWGEEGSVTIRTSILDGLNSSPSGPEFPIHYELWNQTVDEMMGHIESLSVYGDLEV